MALSDFFSKPVEECFGEAKIKIQNSKIDLKFKDKKIRALIVPHAGYVYSGVVAAMGYALLKYELQVTNCELIKIIGFYHGSDRESEHSVKVQIPLIRYVLPEAKIEEMYADEVLEVEVDGRMLVVASSDLSHYLSQEEAEKTDRRTIEGILGRDGMRIRQEADACGLMPVLTINRLANKY